MNKYIVVWEIQKSIRIEAKNEKEARKIIEDEYDPITDGDYIDYSFEILNIEKFPEEKK